VGEDVGNEIVKDTTTMLDTTPVTTAITRLISTGTTEQALLAAVAQLFPNLTPAELSQAAQIAQAAAERAATRKQ
jgi:hypothetical protein